MSVRFSFFFFFNDTATTEIYTLSLHDALPIFIMVLTFTGSLSVAEAGRKQVRVMLLDALSCTQKDRKSTRLNSSHGYISYAVFCLKKKKKTHGNILRCTKIQKNCIIIHW